MVFVTVHEHFIAYCGCREAVKGIYVPAVTVQPDKELQHCAELHYRTELHGVTSENTAAILVTIDGVWIGNRIY
jgi:hypothetical protein